MKSHTHRRGERGFLGLALAALAVGIGTTALGSAYLLGKLTQSRQQALQETSQQMTQGGTWTQAQQDRARDAGSDLNQLLRSGGGGKVVLGVADSTLSAATVSGLVATGALAPVIERATAATTAPTQSVALPPDALKLGPCATATLAFCETRASCIAAGGHWWVDSTCNRQPQPACTATQLEYCFDEATCKAATGDWVDGECTRDLCWQFVETRRVEAPIPRGYAGGSTTVHGLINIDSHPADPQWSHLVTAVSFRWSFNGGEPVRGHPTVYCPGEAISGTASMSNTGNQFSAAAFVPNAYLSMYLNQSPAWTPVWRLGSAELPAPGTTVTRPFSFTAPSGREGDTMSIVAAGYAGRENTYTYVFRRVTKRAFAADATRDR